jgi:tRNA-(ms[2]io[6]A)-hydroxylase
MGESALALDTMGPHLRVLQDILHVPTSEAWLPMALADIDAILVDHAHCEKKAAAAALSLVAQYPEHGTLVQHCVGLAQEELRHFKQVHRLILQRGGALTRDPGDPYARALLRFMRDGATQRMVDRLLICALIEARSCERLGLLGEGLDCPTLAPFYRGLAKAEAGHYRLFVDLARTVAPHPEVDARLQVLCAAEAEIVTTLPVLPRIH